MTTGHPDAVLGLMLGLAWVVAVGAVAWCVWYELVNGDLRHAAAEAYYDASLCRAALAKEHASVTHLREHIQRISAERVRVSDEIESHKAALTGARNGLDRLAAANRELARRLRARRTKQRTPTPARRSR